jgi:hypothetical protein
MEYTQLSPLEVRDLINQYQSDLRKLQFQTLRTQAIIRELEQFAAEAEEALSLEEARIQELPAAGIEKPSAQAADAAPKEKAEAKPEKAEAKSKKTEATTKGKKTGQPKKSKKTGSSTKKKTATQKEDSQKSSKSEASYRLSDWDQFVIDRLKEKQSAMTTSDFASAAVKDKSIDFGEAQIKVKLNRSLHKLANKKNVLVKVEHSGRGFAYALSDWLNSKGELPKKYAHQ